MKQKSIGFFGGSFDPIHVGHLHLALTLLEIHQLDRILFCPTFLSPFKTAHFPHANACHRKEMVRLAIEPIPSFSLYDYELQNHSPSFTIDTIRHLYAEFAAQKQDIQIRLILGEDMLPGLQRWKEIELLLQLAPPLIGSRNNTLSQTAELSERSKNLLQKGYIAIPMLDVSSTYLRERIKHREYCAHLLPTTVLEYIHQNRLYQ